MEIEEKKEYILFNSGEKNFKDFYAFFTIEHKNYTKNNIIINISSNFNLDSSDISLFLYYTDLHQKSGTTFVVIYPNIDVDDLPESFNIVPTLVEAEDVLEMENIQRDLGF